MSPPKKRITCFHALLAGALALCPLAGCSPPSVEKAPEPEVKTERPEASTHHHRSHHHEADDNRRERHNHEETSPPARPRDAAEKTHSSGEIPEKVAKVLRYIDENRAAPAGYEGGRVFHNGGRDGAQVLPRTDAEGRSISYQEWDVNPKVAGVNRGAERLITGSDGSAYFTADHYRTFKKVR
jgi:guanyl-specific ribonuclease Sa